MVRIGVIGAGGIARYHVDCLMQVEKADVVAVADIDSDKAEALAATCGAEATTDYLRLFDRVDAVYVCTTPSRRKEIIADAAEAGKPIFCEKPLAATLEDGRAMVEAVDKHNVPSMMGFNMRFREPFKKLKEVVASDALGNPITYWTTRIGPGRPAEGNWRITPGLLCGMTIESVSHDIDLMRWICGDVTDVHGRVRNSIETLEGFDDNMCAALTLENGAMAVFHVSWSSLVGFNSRGVIGSKGAACVEGPGMWTLARLRIRTLDSDTEQVTAMSDEEANDMAYLTEAKHFIDCMEAGRNFGVSIRDGFEALRVSLAIHESDGGNRVVSLET